MSDPHRIFGVEMSPYSVKVRSYFRYKRIPHQWIVRSAATQAEYQKYARLPIVPLVVTPEGEGIQDSTPILERFEAAHPDPSIHPPEPVSAFVSALLEEFGDEWGNKWMFHYRWARDVDQLCSAGRIAGAMMPAASEETARGHDRADSRADGGPRLVRRLQRADRAADRGLVPRGDRAARRAPGRAPLPVRRAPRLW